MIQPTTEAVRIKPWWRHATILLVIHGQEVFLDE